MWSLSVSKDLWICASGFFTRPLPPSSFSWHWKGQEANPHMQVSIYTSSITMENTRSSTSSKARHVRVLKSKLYGEGLLVLGTLISYLCNVDRESTLPYKCCALVLHFHVCTLIHALVYSTIIDPNL